MNATVRFQGYDAIEMAEREGLLLSTYNSPMELAREDVSVEDARAIVKEDPSLVYLDVPTDENEEVAISLPEALLLRDLNKAWAEHGGRFPRWNEKDNLFCIVCEWLSGLVSRATWGIQPETHGRVFVRKFSPYIASGRTICAVLLDGIEVFRTEPWWDSETERTRFSWEFADMPKQIAARKARKADRSRHNGEENYERHLDMAASDLRTMGLHWTPGQEGGVVYCRDGFRVSARGALRRCGLSRDAAEVLLNDSYNALYAAWNPSEHYDFHSWCSKRDVILIDHGLLCADEPKEAPAPKLGRRASWLKKEMAAYGIAA